MGALSTLTKVVNFLQSGRALASIAPFLAGAKLSAFQKKGTGTDAYVHDSFFGGGAGEGR